MKIQLLFGVPQSNTYVSVLFRENSISADLLGRQQPNNMYNNTVCYVTVKNFRFGR